MPWVTVKDFDRDVKVGDRIRIVYPLAERVHEGIAKWIGERNIINMSNGIECCSSRHLSTDGLWQVWRETNKWRAVPGEMFYYIDTDYRHPLRAKVIYPDDGEYHFNSGNYFKTESQAREYADECKKVAERLHERWGE